jgi:glycosyltransferase involved in cell wall biosynthesis
MHVLVATDAWSPQVNGVVRTLTESADAALRLGSKLSFVTPEFFTWMRCPGEPNVHLALPRLRVIERVVDEIQPTAIHIATEGPIGHAMRRYCLRLGKHFTTSVHTRFPDYLFARMNIPPALTWALMRRFHRASAGVMVATAALAHELKQRGFSKVMLSPYGVDTDFFHPDQAGPLNLQRPVFLTVTRLAVEKNIEAFLKLDLPGTKVVVGDGPARQRLEGRYPDAIFLGTRQGESLAEIYASADVFVFPSRTDTFGIVLLEALASGLPVAAFPVQGPRDVIGNAPVGALDNDLRRACLTALGISRESCRAFAENMTWQASTIRFLQNIALAGTNL